MTSPRYMYIQRKSERKNERKTENRERKRETKTGKKRKTARGAELQYTSMHDLCHILPTDGFGEAETARDALHGRPCVRFKREA